MTQGFNKATYFTKHLFRAGLQCPTKLFYKAKGYPENREALPFIKHAIYNKRLLKALARSIHPDGEFVDGDSIEEAASVTEERLSADETILFDPVFTHRQMMSKLPVIIKHGKRITALHVQTKAFSSRKHRLMNDRGEIHSKWQKYLLDFAYQLFILKQNHPDLSILPLLVVPDKSGFAQTDALPRLLNPLDGNPSAVEVPASNQQLLAKLDVSEPVTKIWEDPVFAEHHLPKSSFEGSLSYLRDLYLQEQKEGPDVGYKCKNCEFNIPEKQKKEGQKSGFAKCWAPEQSSQTNPTDHVFNLIGPGTKQMVEQEVFYQPEVDSSEIMSVGSIVQRNGRITHKMRQALQIHKSKGHEVPEEILRPALGKELRRWRYPLHFLDFEAGNYAVPIRAGRPPYHLVVFQFSCHTLRKDGSWQHHQWIDDLSSGYPNYELVRRLMEIPEINEGTLVQYSNFERNALKVIRRELREEASMISDSDWLGQWIEEIIRRSDSSDSQPPYLADLSRQVKHFYYNSEMADSLSIKDVLQSVMTQSDYLKQKYSQPYNSQNFVDMIWWQADAEGKAQNPYSLLQETGSDAVRRGTEAMVFYGKLIAGNMSKKDRSAYRDSLLRYCELDTLAMLMIFEHWKQKMNQLY